MRSTGGQSSYLGETPAAAVAVASTRKVTNLALGDALVSSWRPLSSSALRRVLDRRELYVVFQPIVDLATHRLFAYEALVRTRAPEFDGPPSMFRAAVAEGLCGELGRMIREIAIDQCPGHPLFLN